VTDRGTDYGVLTNVLGNQGSWLTNDTGKFVFTSPVGHLLVPGNTVVLQRYTDDTYRTTLGTTASPAIIAVVLATTTTRIAFTGITNYSSSQITVQDPTELQVGQYLDPLSGVVAGSYITTKVGNVITLNTPVLNGSAGLYVPLAAYEPTKFRTEPIAGWAGSGSVAIAPDSNTIISQEFNNQVALLIEPPTNSSGTQAAATAYCQNPPSEYTITGIWNFTPDSVGSLNGIAVIEFDTNHTFAKGQQVPIKFVDYNYTANLPLGHSPNDQNQQSGAPSNWYVTAVTDKTITVMASKIWSVAGGYADCTDEGQPNQFFTVGSQYKTGALELISDDNTPKVGSNFMDRSVTVLYQPTSESKSLILREYYNNSEAARINQMARNRGTGFIHELNGAQAVLNMSITRSALGAATGVAKAIFGSRTAADMSGADTHIAIELIIPSELITEDTQLADPPELYGLTINGIAGNDSA